MASVNIFETLRARVEKSGGLLPQERRAMFWFSQYSAALKSWQGKHNNIQFRTAQNELPSQMIVGPRRAFPGYMYFFHYEPIGKHTLPAYDTFPLTLVIKREKNGFIGLNFHYLSYRSRAMLFDTLYQSFVKLGPDPDGSGPMGPDPLKTRMRVTYKMLDGVSKYKAFRPCVKRYRSSRCRTPLLQVGSSEWDLALFLPVEQFRKSTKADVWQESQERIQEQKR
jgi:hypothetical protein